MATNLRDTDPYGGHHIVVHTFPNEQETVYPALLGSRSPFTGASLQNDVEHGARTDAAMGARVVGGEASRGSWPTTSRARRSRRASRSRLHGLRWQGRPGHDVGYTLHDIRKYTLWGNLMAGGAGVEYYFGYELPDNDLVAENFRSRDKSWDYGRIALEFFHAQKIPFWEMKNADELVGNEKHDNSRYCFAKANEVYLVYLPTGNTTTLDLSNATGSVRRGMVRSAEWRCVEERQRDDRQGRRACAAGNASRQSGRRLAGGGSQELTKNEKRKANERKTKNE